MKALCVWGGWEGHTPKESVDRFSPWLAEQGFTVEMADSTRVYADTDTMRGADLIVQCITMSTIEPEQESGLLEAVRNGTGFAGWHGGVADSFRANTGYQFMTGGQFVAHPGNCIPRYDVAVTDDTHTITKNISGFTLTDTERYYMHTDPANHVLCTTTFTGEPDGADLYPPGTVIPYAWTRQYGRGRVFVACWGHTFRDFDVPEAAEIVKRGLLWASR